MSDPYVFTIPLISRLGTIVNWLFFLNTLLVGAVILFAWRAKQLGERVRELETGLNNASRSRERLKPGLSPLGDDKPIPAVRNQEQS
jgi:hypothetical protein